MRYLWVNQNQTFRQEITGGYLWSPKRNVERGVAKVSSSSVSWRLKRAAELLALKI
jgi:hypothetical protein